MRRSGFCTLVGGMVVMLAIAMMVCDTESPSGSQPTPAIDSLFFVEHTEKDSMFCHAMGAAGDWIFRNEDTLYVIVWDVEMRYCPPYVMAHETSGDTLRLVYDLPPGLACLDSLVLRYLEFAFRVTDVDSLHLQFNWRDTLIVLDDIVSENPCDPRKLEYYQQGMIDARLKMEMEANDSCDDASYCRYMSGPAWSDCDYWVVYSTQHTDSASLAVLLNEYSQAWNEYRREHRKYWIPGLCGYPILPPDSFVCDSGRCKAEDPPIPLP